MCALAISFFAAGQQDENASDLPTWKLKNLMDGYSTIGDYFAAIEMAEAYQKRMPQKKLVKLKLAKLYLQSRNYATALSYYQELLNNGFDNDPEVHFNTALALKQTGNYQAAVDLFNTFKKKFKPSRKNREFFSNLESELLGSQQALSFANDTNMQVVNAGTGVNYPHVDFAPFPIGDNELMYASLRESSAQFDIDNPQLRQFYLVKKTGESDYQNLLFPFDFNDSTSHCGNGSFSNDGRFFVYSKCPVSKSGKVSPCQLHWSIKVDDVWTKSVPVPGNINVPTFTSSYPCFGKDSKGNLVLYFSSNRPGGKGGMDLWYSVFEKEQVKFKNPKNCGKELNTPRDEISPFCMPEKKVLFYSSNGLPGFGGLDIFKTEGELRRWNSPKNLGTPLNSSTDDLQYIERKNSGSGYIVSNRPGGQALENGTCCDDIYEFSNKKDLSVILLGTVIENTELAQGHTFDQPGSIGLYLDINSKLVLVDKQTLPSPINFKFTLELNAKYRIIAERPGFLKGSKSISTYGISHTDTIYSTPVIRALSDAPVVVKNIYYPFDKDYLTAQSKEILDTTIFKLMSDNPEIIVEIGSHTDGLGTIQYNDDLSQRRAQSVVNYLISLGIEAQRLSAHGYGFRVPIAPNIKTDGSDNPEGRQKNRRTEFRIIGVLPGVSDIIYEE